MYQGKKQQFDWTFVLMVCDFTVVLLSFFLANSLIPGGIHPRLPVSIAYALVIFFFMRKMGLYSWSSFNSFSQTTRKVGYALLASVVTFLVCRFLFRDPTAPDFTTWLVLQAALIAAILLPLRLGVHYLLMTVFDIVPKERIAFIGWSVRLDRVLKSLAHEMGRFQSVVGFFSEPPAADDDPALKNGYPPLSTLDRIEQKLQEEKISLLIIDESSITTRQLQRIGEICARCFVNLKIIPNSFDIWTSSLNLRVVNGVPLLGVYDLHYDRFHNRLAKRALDIVCAVFGLLVSAPLIALLVFQIKRESPGPVFYRQTRLGQYGDHFLILKLRSMRTDAEAPGEAGWTVEDDPRRLKIGTFMRKWNLDELPQFWNVLRGEMSMVGPRPERPEFVEGFKETIRYYNLRHSCKPGITGWAAVHGLRGNTSLEDRLEYDLFYIENWSLFLDIRIMVMTLAPPKNAY